MGIPWQNFEMQNAGCESRFNTHEPHLTRSLVKSLEFKSGLSVVTIISTRKLRSSVFLQRVFTLLEQQDIHFDFVTVSEIAVSVVLDNLEKLQAIERELSDISQLKIESNKAAVCIVADELRLDNEIASQVFCALEMINVSLISQSEKGTRLNIVVSETDIDLVAFALFERVFEKRVSPASTNH